LTRFYRPAQYSTRFPFDQKKKRLLLLILAIFHSVVALAVGPRLFLLLLCCLLWLRGFFVVLLLAFAANRPLCTPPFDQPNWKIRTQNLSLSDSFQKLFRFGFCCLLILCLLQSENLEANLCAHANSKPTPEVKITCSFFSLPFDPSSLCFALSVRGLFVLSFGLSRIVPILPLGCCLLSPHSYSHVPAQGQQLCAGLKHAGEREF
jgi:hypothetical protein